MPLERSSKTLDFIRKAEILHGNVYDYSQVNYITAIVKVDVICRRHGSFKITPNGHLSGGHGCKFCGTEKCTKASQHTHEQFIEKLKILYNGSMPFKVISDYVNNRSKITVEDEFGIYSMTASHMMEGSRPSLLTAIDKTSNAIARFRKKHGEKYIYDDFKYVKAQQKSRMDCALHGSFYLAPDTHLQGVGCAACGKISSKINQTSTKEEFVEKANKIHKNFYNYEDVVYEKANKHIFVRCYQHGEFKITPNNHTRGKGCPKCALEKISIINGEISTGWSLSRWTEGGSKSKTFDSFKVYFVKVYDKEEYFYKIGRTYRTVDDRLVGIPYFYDVILITSHDDPKIIFDLENHLKRTFKAHKYKPLKSFGGQHECFALTPELIESVKRQMTLPSSSDIIPTSS